MIYNTQNSRFHHHLEDVFLNEEYQQARAARDFMRAHFRYGLDPKPITYDKGCVTAQNMVSAKYNNMSKAEKFRAEMAKRHTETITMVKIENSLLCQ